MIKREARRPAAARAGVLLTCFLSSPALASIPDWSPAETAVRSASVPLIGMLVIALVILFAYAWYRVATGKSIDNDDD